MYNPSQKILNKYADLLVNFALNNGKGIKRGDVVFVSIGEAGKPLLYEIRKEILKAGGHMIVEYSPCDGIGGYNFSEEFYEFADEHQLDFFPKKYLKGLVDQADHMLFIIVETDKRALQKVDSKKVVRRLAALKPYQNWRREKENEGKLSWTIALYGTEATAKEAGLTLKSCWSQIIEACFLDKPDPKKEFAKIFQQIAATKEKLDDLKIERVHVEGSDVDLWLTIGADRVWRSGEGANIPSFEVFTSPHMMGTEGWIRFNQPLYRYGKMITGIELFFEKGKVVKSKAKKNSSFLKELIAIEGGDKVGEFSLTDRRMSRIKKFMAETLYDENISGEYGNMHIALGKSFGNECYRGNASKLKKKDWQRLGFNESVVHSDIISTTDRKVTAFWGNNEQKIIYDKGEFKI